MGERTAFAANSDSRAVFSCVLIIGVVNDLSEQPCFAVSLTDSLNGKRPTAAIMN